MNLRHLLAILTLLAFITPTTAPAASDDWGAYSLVPASAKGFVLEAVASGTADGTRVSIDLERMIATKEVPVIVGVFVAPGEVPSPIKGMLGRRNRDFEYDGVNDNNARFLIEELLPFIAKKYSLNFSTDGNDRCISGGSSGGIAAFTAAWNRPDAFSRVYAASGSWVAFRGGHEFPTMVRKFEAKPIRTFLASATHDMENCAGDWFLLDQEMDKALKFSGYDYQFRIVDGPHVAGYMDHWQEAMAYLWRGWPARITTGPGAPRAREILIPGEGWRLLAEGFKSTRGPACNASGEVFFADTSDNKIHRIDQNGKVSVFVADAGAAHCITVGPDGSLFTVSEKSGKVMRYDASGKGSVVIEGIVGHSVIARSDGILYVTNNGDQPSAPGTVWLIKNGKKTKVDTGVKFATGIAYRPDQWLLSVAEGHSKWVYSYQVNEDGTLSNKERFFHLHVDDWDDDAGAESLCYSIEGRQFIATRSGVQITADDGPTQVIVPVPDHSRVTGVALGGAHEGKRKQSLRAAIDAHETTALLVALGNMRVADRRTSRSQPCHPSKLAATARSAFAIPVSDYRRSVLSVTMIVSPIDSAMTSHGTSSHSRSRSAVLISPHTGGRDITLLQNRRELGIIFDSMSSSRSALLKSAAAR